MYGLSIWTFVYSMVTHKIVGSAYAICYAYRIITQKESQSDAKHNETHYYKIEKYLREAYFAYFILCVF